MWVTVAPAACTHLYEIDNRSSWLEKDKDFFFLLTRGFPVTVDLTPHSQRALGLLFFLPTCASLLLFPAQHELETVFQGRTPALC